MGVVTQGEQVWAAGCRRGVCRALCRSPTCSVPWPVRTGGSPPAQGPVEWSWLMSGCQGNRSKGSASEDGVETPGEELHTWPWADPGVGLGL